jgi:hypothetical protein
MSLAHAALLDRLTHLCEIFEMNGESYGFRELMKEKQSATAAKSSSPQTDVLVQRELE